MGQEEDLPLAAATNTHSSLTNETANDFKRNVIQHRFIIEHTIGFFRKWIVWEDEYLECFVNFAIEYLDDFRLKTMNINIFR